MLEEHEDDDDDWEVRELSADEDEVWPCGH